MAQPGLHPQDDSGSLSGHGGGSALRRRPRQATIAGVLLIIFGALAILVALALLATVNDATDHGESVSGILYVLVYGQFILSAAQIVSGIFVLVGKPWARVLAVVICSLNLLGGVVSLVTGNFLQALFGIVINGALIATLNRNDVRDWCG
jgi:hypothetical protein